jgi:hypothetical protein
VKAVRPRPIVLIVPILHSDDRATGVAFMSKAPDFVSIAVIVVLASGLGVALAITAFWGTRLASLTIGGWG